MRRYVVWAVLGAVASVWAAPAAATEATDRVRAVVNEVLAIQNDPGLQGPQYQERRGTEVKRVIAQSFNFGVMARSSLGREWERLDPAQRKDFTDVLQDLFEDSYSKLVLNFLKRETIRYGAETVKGNDAQVKTVIERLAREQIPVDYQLLRDGARWDIVDVVIDGVSIVGTYRSQFTKIIRTSSYDALIKKMKIKREEITPAQR